MSKKSFDPDLYGKIPTNCLIVFCIYSITEKKEKCNFERLIKECFTLFPKSFNFPSFPKWPDSRKLDRSLRTLRKKKLLEGDPKTIFSLTKSGKKTAEGIAKIFSQRKLKI